MDKHEVSLTLITSSQPKVLTKQCSLDNAGTMHCKASANMYMGEAQQVQVTTANDFANLLQSLSHNQALCYGVAHVSNIRMLSLTEYEKQGKPADAITRTKDRLAWPTGGGGVLMLDYDPQEGQLALSKVQLLKILIEVMPELEASAYVWWLSSSSLIYNGVEQLTGIRGQRVYIFVADAQDIPRAGDILFKRLWLAGHGFYMISRAGTALERTLIDASVWQTNRLDFAAGAQCMPPLEQRRGVPEAHEGAYLDTTMVLPDLTLEEEEDLQEIKDKLKDQIAPNAQVRRAEYIEKEARNLLTSAGKDVSDGALKNAKNTISRAVQGGVLAGDFIIMLDDKTEITIGELLDNPSKYHKRNTLDPLEPEYNGHKIVGILYLMGGQPNLFSQAHGGKKYRLIREPREIQQVEGTTTETTHRTLEYMRQLPEVFDLGDLIVLVRDGKIHRQTHSTLAYWLGSVAQFFQYNKNLEKRLLDPPVKVLNQILDLGEGRKLKQLKAVITAPVITKAGRVIDRTGYDTETKLYLDMQQDPLPIRNEVTDDHARAALDFLMHPFKDFMTATPVDKGVLLASILTAVLRPVLKTAPAIALDAPVQGSGKTYLAQCLGALSTGETPAAYPHTSGRDDEEVRKRITTVLVSGARVLVWDNILGIFDSATIATFLTTEVFNDRILGKTEEISMPNRMLMILTGNNLTLAGDLPRRVIVCRLDAQVANPATRKFNSNPLEYITKNRQQLVQAALTLVKGYFQSLDYAMGGAVPNESTASFEEWDHMVRQTVAWVPKGLGIDGYVDPAEALKQAVATDPEAETLRGVLNGIQALMGDRWFEARELHKSINANTGGAELGELLQDLTGTHQLTSRGLGRILGYRVGRIVGNLKIEKIDGGRVIRWRVVTVEAEQAAA